MSDEVICGGIIGLAVGPFSFLLPYAGLMIATDGEDFFASMLIAVVVAALLVCFTAFFITPAVCS